MSAIFTISNVIISGFTCTTILLSIVYLFNATLRQTIAKVLEISSVYLLIASTIFLVLSLIGLLPLFGGNDDFTKIAVANRLFGPYWFVYWSAITFKGLLPQILWIMKIRKKTWTPIALVPFLLLGIFAPLLELRDGDYLGSSWKTGFAYNELLYGFVIYGLILMVTHLLARRMNAT